MFKNYNLLNVYKMVLSKKPVVKQAQVAGRMENIRQIDKRVKALEIDKSKEETKKRYTQFNEVIVNNSSATLPVWTPINQISQGDSANTVDGISYTLTGIAMKFLLHNNTGTAGIVRLAIIRLKSGQTMTSIGENLFTGSNSLGLDFNSATEQQRYYLPINTKRYDVIMQRTIKIGALNSTYTDNFDANKLVKGYKSYKGRKEFTNTSSGGMDTNYYLVGWSVDTALDTNSFNVELTGETTVYFKDN
jgi:hypothetical protein|uniref:hypothetical protein n=1 Tax=Polynucleobacter sp. TaxID=2029855 RepID=UPI0040472A70